MCKTIVGWGGGFSRTREIILALCLTHSKKYILLKNSVYELWFSNIFMLQLLIKRKHLRIKHIPELGHWHVGANVVLIHCRYSSQYKKKHINTLKNIYSHWLMENIKIKNCNTSISIIILEHLFWVC